MIPTAVSQVVESLGKLVLGIAFAKIAQSHDLSTEKVAAFAILGLSVGTMISTLYLCLKKFRMKLTLERAVLENQCETVGFTVKRLVKLAIPVTVSSVLVSLTRIVDMTVLMHRLDHSLDRISIYGSYSTMALPIYNLPSSLVAGIALALVPSITNAVKMGQAEREKQLTLSGIKLCAVISLPAALGIGVYSRQILELLFLGENDAAAIAAPLLSALSVSVFSSCLIQVTNSVLQANGRTFCPIISMLCGMAVKCVSAYILIGISEINSMGAPLSTLFCNVTAVGMNLWFIGKYTAFDINIAKILNKPFVCSVISMAFSLGAYLVLTNVGIEKVAFLVAMLICVLTYVIAVLFGNVLDVEEFSMIPGGTRISNFYGKLKSVDKK